jgi:hypothetical protein
MMTLTNLTIAIAIIGISLHIRFFYLLRKNHPTEWQQLGSPNPFLPNGRLTGKSVTKYTIDWSVPKTLTEKARSIGPLPSVCGVCVHCVHLSFVV